MQANYVQRLRLIFGKMGPTRFIGHLDLARTLERSLNRAQIPLAYTQGFNPRPRLQFAAALPLGFTSDCEIADFWLLEHVDPIIARQHLESTMAPGIVIHDLIDVDVDSGAIQNQIRAALYQVWLRDPFDPYVLHTRISKLLAKKSIMRERRGKDYDLRPLIFKLICQETETDHMMLMMELSLLPGKTGRPDEVLRALDIDPLTSLIHRKEFYFLN